MIAYVFSLLIIAGTVLSVAFGNVQALSETVMGSAQDSAALCLNMMGTYMLWMGIMNIAKEAGLMDKLAGLVKRPLAPLFAGAAASKTAMGYITMNIAANMLGLGNAATPFGLKAISELNEINDNKSLPSHDMCAFLVLNTASVQLLPTSVVAVRAAAGSSAPYEIVPWAFLTTLLTAALGVVICIIMRKKG